EMGHLYYDELDIDGGGSLSNPVNFQNLEPRIYWSDTVVSAGPIGAWTFSFKTGGQYMGDRVNEKFYGLAVRSGDVAATVPEPTTAALLGIGLAGMAGFSRYHKYILGTDLRNKSREIVSLIVKANSSQNMLAILHDSRG
ncbi:MAG: PEP-CTERM sorting domain-containing protein, partial [Aestuariibacter sp.]|nr:PEP-CTERM sorting domain-containing protein [Aestuariibacter sp.]